MNIVIKTDTSDLFTTVTSIFDGKNTLTITEENDLDTTTTTLHFSDDSIYPFMDLLKILEVVR